MGRRSDQIPRRDIHGIRPVPVRNYGQYAGAAALLLFAAIFIETVATNANMQWPVVWQYLFHRAILAGLGMTLMLTVLAMVIGLAIGVRIHESRVKAGKGIEGS
jgi:polar amino acid transport system permease protein